MNLWLSPRLILFDLNEHQVSTSLEANFLPIAALLIEESSIAYKVGQDRFRF
jgi:hypothetical protein